MLHPVSSCWYAHLCFIFYFCLPLNPTVVPTAEVRLIYQRGMDYCFVYNGELFLPGFLLLTETSSCVPGAINCNKEDMTIMPCVKRIAGESHESFDVSGEILKFSLQTRESIVYRIVMKNKSSD